MKYINKGNQSTKEGFGIGLKKAGQKHPNIIALGADITSSVGVNYFADTFPERFYSMGIAEQNCIGVAAGLGLSGKIPVFSTYGVFAALRTTDQIRISLCYNNVHAIIGGAHAGVSVGQDGATHQALEDIAIMRALPNMIVLSPCDATQTEQAMIAAVEKINSPVYLRFGRAPVPDFIDIDSEFIPGKAQILVEGNDITLAATGHMVWEALQSAKLLNEKGISARVINFHTIKPIDKETIIKASKETKMIVTLEEHQTHAGFGSAIAEVIVEHAPCRVKMIGMQNCFGESGKPEELMFKYGLKAEGITKNIMYFLRSCLNFII
jgi:transketolase